MDQRLRRSVQVWYDFGVNCARILAFVTMYSLVLLQFGVVTYSNGGCACIVTYTNELCVEWGGSVRETIKTKALEQAREKYVELQWSATANATNLTGIHVVEYNNFRLANLCLEVILFPLILVLIYIALRPAMRWYNILTRLSDWVRFNGVNQDVSTRNTILIRTLKKDLPQWLVTEIEAMPGWQWTSNPIEKAEGVSTEV